MGWIDEGLRFDDGYIPEETSREGGRRPKGAEHDSTTVSEINAPLWRELRKMMVSQVVRK